MDCNKGFLYAVLMTLGSDDIKGYLRNNFGIDPDKQPIFADSTYTCPTREWFYNDYAAMVGQVWNQLRPKWYRFQRWFRPESWDCDDFTRGAAWIAQIMHRETGLPGAMAVGEYWYYRNGNPADEHAILIAVFGPNDIGFFEPQNCQNVRLRPDEMCTWYRF